MKVAIVGVTGYTGIELMRLIQGHPHLEIGTLCSSTMHKNDIAELYPHLKGLVQQPVEAFDAKKIMAENELVFFATPAGISKENVAVFLEADFPVIDLSGDLRLKNPADYQKWYQKTPAATDILEKAFYAVPEFYDKPVGNLISNPGCYATATELTLSPLIKNHLIDLDSIVIDAKSGLSGAGKKLTEASHFVNVQENMSMYKVNQHQHIPEIVAHLKQFDQELKTLQFTTSLLPITRGILVSSYVKLKAGTTKEQVAEAFAYYDDKPFVRMQEENQLPQIKQVIGSNFCDIGYVINPENNYLTLVTVIDNLVKGAAGLALQNFNKWAGIDETSGLLAVPIFP